MNTKKREGKVAVIILGIILIGLGIYIGSFFLDVGGDFKQVSEQQEYNRQADPSLQNLLNAEALVMSDSKGTEHGNNLKAKRIALQYSVALGNLRKELFTEGKQSPLSLTNGVFLTYCNIGDERCAIIVHVPQLGDYTEDAKQVLHQIAWDAAVNTLQNMNQENISSISVGVRGAMRYDVVLIGNQEGVQKSLGHIEGRKALKDYF